MQTKLLILVDWPCYNYLSQFLPLAKYLSENAKISTFVTNPVSLHLVNHLPFIDEIHCLKLDICNSEIQLSLISKEEGLCAPIDYFFLSNYFPGQCGTPPSGLNIKISDEIFYLINRYDKILVLYDGKFEQTTSFFNQIIERFEHKIFGRVGSWHKDCLPYNDNKYMPQESVESFGYQWGDELLKLNLDWYKDYKPDWMLFENRSVGLTCSAGCETYMPINEEKTYYKAAKLSNLLKKMGFKVCLTNRNDDIRKQLFLQCQYHIIVDSIAVWTLKGIGNPNVFLISENDTNLERRLGLDNLLKDCKSLRDIEPEVIIESFKEKVIKI